MFKMETLEMGAQIGLLSRLLGGAQQISPENVERLLEVRRNLGVAGGHPAMCELPEAGSPRAAAQPDGGNTDEARLKAIITQVVKEVLAEQRR
jgi:L-fuculose-phosphate aldolase